MNDYQSHNYYEKNCDNRASIRVILCYPFFGLSLKIIQLLFILYFDLDYNKIALILIFIIPLLYELLIPQF